MITLTSNYTAVVPGADFVQFVASGGIAPYLYEVVVGGAGGTIDGATGSYTAADTMIAYPATKLFDTIQVTDAIGDTAQRPILVATPLFLVCDIIQKSMNLDANHCYLWDQKIMQPKDSNLYVAVSLSSCTPFGNTFRPLEDGSVQQYVSMHGRIDIDAISRSPAARDQKELIVMALNSFYSQQQQEANGFYIGKIPVMGGFINLSQIDGTAIPYRYKISFAIQYQMTMTQSVQYYDEFSDAQIVSNP